MHGDIHESQEQVLALFRLAPAQRLGLRRIEPLPERFRVQLCGTEDERVFLAAQAPRWLLRQPALAAAVEQKISRAVGGWPVVLVAHDASGDLASFGDRALSASVCRLDLEHGPWIELPVATAAR
jgi:hypothetical protein